MMEFEPVEAQGGLVMMQDEEECLASDCLYLEYLAANRRREGTANADRGYRALAETFHLQVDA